VVCAVGRGGRVGQAAWVLAGPSGVGFGDAGQGYFEAEG
jgi:hypothetical protein